jgi:hypothetical protein
VGWTLLLVITLILAVAGKHLPSTDRTAFHIATGHMKLPFDNRAITTWVAIGPPVLIFLPVRNSGIFDPVYYVGLFFLRSHDLLGPTLDDLCTIVLYEFLIHCSFRETDDV